MGDSFGVAKSDELAQLVEAVAEKLDADSVQVVLVNQHTGYSQFVEYTGRDQVLTDLSKALEAGAMPPRNPDLPV